VIAQAVLRPENSQPWRKLRHNCALLSLPKIPFLLISNDLRIIAGSREDMVDDTGVRVDGSPDQGKTEPCQRGRVAQVRNSMDKQQVRRITRA